MTQPPTSTDVLIAGAGPTGLTLALTLSLLGVDVLVVDPQPAPSRGDSRANLMHAGSLERLDTLGVAGELIERGAVAERSEVRSRGHLLAVNDWTRLDSRFPMALLVPQHETEDVLGATLAAIGRRPVRGWAVTDFAAHNDAVTVELTADGPPRQVTARCLVGCDGSHSTVRERIGLGFHGTSYRETLLVADCWSDDVPEGFSGVFFTPQDGFLVATGMRAGVTRAGASVEPGFEPTESSISDLVADRSRGVIVPRRIESSSLFRTHRRLVERMHDGRVVLAGDAAHVHSPAGGQGMNLGIRDAFDLGHRLAAHIAGDVPLDTLDEYDAQRRTESTAVLNATNRLLRIYTARGVRRRVLDRLLALGSRIGASERIMVAMSGIETPWPPGIDRPAPT